MLCQVCLKNRAKFHIPKIVDNRLVEMHLCKECNSMRNNHELTNNIEEGLDSILAELLKSNSIKRSKSDNTICSKCGTVLEDFKESGFVGCPDCYKAFESYITKNIERGGAIFDNKRKDDLLNIIESLKVELNRAVELENFEKAAKLRDEILKYEKEGFASENRRFLKE